MNKCLCTAYISKSTQHRGFVKSYCDASHVWHSRHSEGWIHANHSIGVRSAEDTDCKKCKHRIACLLDSGAVRFYEPKTKE